MNKENRIFAFHKDKESIENGILKSAVEKGILTCKAVLTYMLRNLIIQESELIASYKKRRI